MTKVIEIVVIGGTGTGKSHVLELIDKALRAEYGHHVQIASHELSCERALGSTGAKPRVSDTIFSLREQGLDSGKTVGSLKIEIDTSAALGQVEALQGCTTGYAIDPIESAITNAAQAANEVEGPTAVILQDHLKKVCELQRIKLCAKAVNPLDHFAIGGYEGAASDRLLRDLERGSAMSSAYGVKKAGA